MLDTIRSDAKRVWENKPTCPRILSQSRAEQHSGQSRHAGSGWKQSIIHGQVGCLKPEVMMENKSKQMYSREGIGTHWWFELLGEPGFPAATKRRIDTVMDDFHRDYTRFTDTSYVGRLNNLKTLRGFPGELYDMMVFAKDMYRVSDGCLTSRSAGATRAWLRRPVSRGAGGQNFGMKRNSLEMKLPSHAKVSSISAVLAKAG